MRSFFAILIFAVILVFAVFYFIPAFRGDMIVHPFLNLGILTFRWYGLIAAVALLLGYFAARKVAPRLGIESQKIENMILFAVIFGFVGARFYFVIFSWSYFSHHLGEIIQVWRGGLSWYGGVLGGVLGLYFFARRGKIGFLKLLDLAAVILPLAHSLGRWGNFFNQEAFGLPTSLPWKLYIAPEYRPAEYLQNQYFHPTFLYESLWDFAVFLILLYLSRRSPKIGYLSGSYFVFYSLGRFFIEPLRVDSFYFGLGVRIDQIASLLAFAIGFLLIFYSHHHERSLEKNP